MSFPTGALAALSLALLSASPSWADVPAELHIPGDRVFPESITSATDGTVYVGSVLTGDIFRVPAGGDTAAVWIPAGTDGMKSIFGVYADSASRTLWACSNELDPTGRATPSHGELHAYDLASGGSKGHFAFPAADAFCNDIAVSVDGSVYATDTNNMQIVRLRANAQHLEAWSAAGIFGQKGDMLDGISIISGSVIVNTLNTGRLFSVTIAKDGTAGAADEIKLSRTLDHPDGMRSFGRRSVLIVEGGGVGTLSKIVLRAGRGQVSTLKAGFIDGPTAVTLVGSTAYVLGAQFKVLAAGGDAKPDPFRATAVPVGWP